MTLDEVMELTACTSGAAAFEQPCCELYFRTLMGLPMGAAVMEIGVEYGRSTSILLQVARERQHRVVLVDPFVDPESGPSFMRMAAVVGHPFQLLKMRSWEAYELGLLPRTVDCCLIDGDHTADGVGFDTKVMAGRVVRDGVLCWHDYGHDSLPDVKPAVDNLLGHGEYEVLAQAHTLLVTRRRG